MENSENKNYVDLTTPKKSLNKRKNSTLRLKFLVVAAISSVLWAHSQMENATAEKNLKKEFGWKAVENVHRNSGLSYDDIEDLLDATIEGCQLEGVGSFKVGPLASINFRDFMLEYEEGETIQSILEEREKIS